MLIIIFFTTAAAKLIVSITCTQLNLGHLARCCWGPVVINMNSTNETLLFDRFLSVWLCVFSHVLSSFFIVLFTCANVICIKLLLTYFLTYVLTYLPSVLWHCWLGGRKGIQPVKMGIWWRWAVVSPDGVAPSRMVSLPLHHEVQRFSSGTGSPGWSQKESRKTVVVCVYVCYLLIHCVNGVYVGCSWSSWSVGWSRSTVISGGRPVTLRPTLSSTSTMSSLWSCCWSTETKSSDSWERWKKSAVVELSTWINNVQRVLLPTRRWWSEFHC